MKSLLLIPLILLTSLPAEGRQSQAGWSRQCFKTVYREEYVPGTANRRGYVRSWTEKVERPCRPDQTQSIHHEDNSCVEGSILGGIIGAGIGGAAATQENWIWSIPAGIVSGAMVGCQIDGG